MVLYKYKDYEIREPIKDKDVQMVYDRLYASLIGSKKPITNIKQNTAINSVKNIVRSLFLLTNRNETYLVLKDNKYIGHIIFDRKRAFGLPVVKRMFILKEYRKTKALTCVGDFVFNYLYRDSQVISLSKEMPGFKGKIEPIFKDRDEPVWVKDLDRLRKMFAKACKGAIYE